MNSQAPHLSEIPANARSLVNTQRGGLDIPMGTGDNNATVVSETWTVAGWRIQFIRLCSGQSLVIDAHGTPYLKVITGELVDPGFTGPHLDVFVWQNFHALFGHLTNLFEGVDAYMVPGFHLLDSNGAEIVYVHFWTAGKGVDLSTHNHGNDPSPKAPAFAEVHWVFCNGTGNGGMYECEAPGAQTRSRHPMQRGEEHGPFFFIDAATQMPRLKSNGAVDYPWHGWQAGSDDAVGQAYDFVAAFEINPQQAKVL